VSGYRRIETKHENVGRKARGQRERKGQKKRIKRNEIRSEELTTVFTLTFAVLS
jgi:hypothetical protein